jgi:hypothetical protein
MLTIRRYPKTCVLLFPQAICLLALLLNPLIVSAANLTGLSLAPRNPTTNIRAQVLGAEQSRPARQRHDH